MRRFGLLVVAALMSLSVSVYGATLPLSGTVSVANGGVYAVGNAWGDEFSVKYTVTQEGTLFRYVYEVNWGSGGGAGISHFDIEVSTNFTLADVKGYGPGTGIEVKTGTETTGEFDWDSSTGKYLKFNFGSDNKPFTYWLLTTRAPVLGSFLAKGGGNNPSNTATTVGTVGNYDTGYMDFYVPDTATVIPLPAAAWAGLALMGGLFAKRVISRRQKA